MLSIAPKKQQRWAAGGCREGRSIAPGFLLLTRDSETDGETAAAGFYWKRAQRTEGFWIHSSLPGSAHIQDNKAKQSLLNPGAAEAESDPHLNSCVFLT